MKTLCMAFALAGIMVAVIGSAPARGDDRQSAPPEKTAAVKEMEGTICPVQGGPIDKRYSYIYKGTKYYFCCPACIVKFQADPEKYIKKVPNSK